MDGSVSPGSGGGGAGVGIAGGGITRSGSGGGVFSLLSHFGTSGSVNGEEGETGGAVTGGVEGLTSGGVNDGGAIVGGATGGVEGFTSGIGVGRISSSGSGGGALGTAGFGTNVGGIVSIGRGGVTAFCSGFVTGGISVNPPAGRIESFGFDCGAFTLGVVSVVSGRAGVIETFGEPDDEGAGAGTIAIPIGTGMQIGTKMIGGPYQHMGGGGHQHTSAETRPGSTRLRMANVTNAVLRMEILPCRRGRRRVLRVYEFP